MFEVLFFRQEKNIFTWTIKTNHSQHNIKSILYRRYHIGSKRKKCLNPKLGPRTTSNNKRRCYSSEAFIIRTFIITKEQPFENAVATLIKKSVDGTNKFAGDGTTSSTIMIGEIVSCALRKLLVGNCTSR